VCDNVRVGLVGHSIVVRGEVQSADDLVIEGRVDGPVWGDGQSITVAVSATVTGDILARHIIVLGRVAGTIIASGLVDIRSSGRVAGRVLAAGFALSDGATFDGSVEPQHLEAALSVARHRRAEHSHQGKG
jgi:cytoskeletal protein CcmA (bactofilin family)